VRVFLAVFTAVALSGAAPAQAQAPVGAGKVYSSSEGERVSVIPLTPLEGNQALLYVEGTGSEFDGKVLPHEVQVNRDDTYYTTQRRGRGYTTLYGRQRNGTRTWRLSVPGRQDDLQVSYDEKRSEALKPEALYTLYKKQEAEGTLAKLMAFDRKAEEAGQEGSFAEGVKSFNAACGTSVAARIDWSTVPDELLKALSIHSFCGSPLTALERLCTSESVKKALADQVRQVDCRFGSELRLELKEGKLTWTTWKDGANQEEFSTQYFEQNLAAPGGKSLGEWLRWEKTAVCTDGKGHYVVAAPSELKLVELFYGDGSQFVQVPPPPFGLSGYDFLEPRFVDSSRNPSFRGHDMRVYSGVDLDKEKQGCAVRCGARTVPFKLLAREESLALLQKATFGPNPQKYVPYALLRDSKGRYYLVDRGFRKEDERRFRVFIGLKGDMKQQQMVDLVSDSEGEIFSTKKGELRLVVDRAAPSLWIENSKKLELRPVPVQENLPLIYNDLGVYTGERLGTPCDDL
jgi:hypothetical protein